MKLMMINMKNNNKTRAPSIQLFSFSNCVGIFLLSKWNWPSLRLESQLARNWISCKQQTRTIFGFSPLSLLSLPLCLCLCLCSHANSCVRLFICCVATKSRIKLCANQRLIFTQTHTVCPVRVCAVRLFGILYFRRRSDLCINKQLAFRMSSFLFFFFLDFKSQNTAMNMPHSICQHSTLDDGDDNNNAKANWKWIQLFRIRISCDRKNCCCFRP